jgi:hypothetical protein
MDKKRIIVYVYKSQASGKPLTKSVDMLEQEWNLDKVMQISTISHELLKPKVTSPKNKIYIYSNP